MSRRRGFRAWLRTMVCRPDPVGDLARDMETAWRVLRWQFPAHPRSLEVVQRHMEVHGACREALEAAQEAWEEFQVFESGVREIWAGTK